MIPLARSGDFAGAVADRGVPAAGDFRDFLGDGRPRRWPTPVAVALQPDPAPDEKTGQIEKTGHRHFVLLEVEPYRTVTNGSASSRVPCRMAPHCTLCVAPSHLDPRVQKPLLHPRVQMACIRAPANRSLGGSPGGPRLRFRPSWNFEFLFHFYNFLLNLLLVRSPRPRPAALPPPLAVLM